MAFSNIECTTRHVCPKCDCKQFMTTAHVVQDWIVDENGNFIESHATTEVIALPNNDNIWTCINCGEEAILQHTYHVRTRISNRKELNKNLMKHRYDTVEHKLYETIWEQTNRDTYQTIRLTVAKDERHPNNILAAGISLYYKDTLLEYYENLPQIPSKLTITPTVDHIAYDITIKDDAD